MRTLVNIGMINDRRAVIREVKRSVVPMSMCGRS